MVRYKADTECYKVKSFSSSIKQSKEWKVRKTIIFAKWCADISEYLECLLSFSGLLKTYKGVNNCQKHLLWYTWLTYTCLFCLLQLLLKWLLHYDVNLFRKISLPILNKIKSAKTKYSGLDLNNFTSE